MEIGKRYKQHFVCVNFDIFVTGKNSPAMRALRKNASEIVNRTKSSDGLLLLFLLSFRTLNSFLITTVFEPDEIFQNIEPIPFIFRGTNAPTWDWMLGIRSINYVLLYLIPSYLPYKTGNMYVAYITPKIINGIVSSLTDYFTVKTARFFRIDALSITVLSHGLWLYSPRSHINSFETFIGITSFYFLEKFKRENLKREAKIKPGNLRIFMYLMLYGVFLRPSVSLLNLVPFLYCLAEIKPYLQIAWMVPELLLFLGLLIMNDSLYYGELIFVPYNFIKVNILCSVSLLFGEQPWFSHFFFALVLLGVTLPIFLFRAYKFKLIVVSVSLFFVFYSLLSHKEMRFILPIIPFCNIVAAKKAQKFFYFYLVSLLISIYIGMYYQNVDSSITFLQEEIKKVDAQNSYGKNINIFYCLWPYLMPTYPFLPNERVYIKELNANPDIYSKMPHPKIYKRFKDQKLIVNEHAQFLSNLRENAKVFLEYDFVLIHRPYYEEIEDFISDYFHLERRIRYFPWFLDQHTCAFIYVLRNNRLYN